MKIASVAEIKSRFSSYLKASEDGPVVVTRNGKPVAVLLSVEDEDELERLVLAYSPRFRTILETAREQIRQGSGVRHQEFWQEVERDAPGAPGRRGPRRTGLTHWPPGARPQREGLVG